MSQSDISRLERDLQTLRAVTGVDLPFDQADARATLLIAGCAFLPALAAFAGAESRWLLGVAALPFGVAVLGMVWRNYRATAPANPCPHEKRREYRPGLFVTLACVPLIFWYRSWATRGGAPADVANGTILIGIGFVLFLDGVTRSSRRSVVLPGIAAMCGGLLWPYCEFLTRWTMLWFLIGLGLAGAAMMMQRQLGSRGEIDDASH